MRLFILAVDSVLTVADFKKIQVSQDIYRQNKNQAPVINRKY